MVIFKKTSFTLQVLAVREFAAVEKRNIRQRIMLSDGHSTILAMMSDRVQNLMGAVNIPKYSIVKVSGNMQTNKIQGKQ